MPVAVGSELEKTAEIKRVFKEFKVVSPLVSSLEYVNILIQSENGYRVCFGHGAVFPDCGLSGFELSDLES